MSKKMTLRKYQQRKRNKAKKYDRSCKIVAVMTITNALTKKGKIKGRNKKETKLLRDSCVHHLWDKRERCYISPIFSNADGTRVCEMCGAKFSSHFYENAELKNVIRPMLELTNQLKFMTVAIGADNKTVDAVVQAHVLNKRLAEIYKNCRKVAASKSKVKKYKKGKKHQALNQYGSWK